MSGKGMYTVNSCIPGMVACMHGDVFQPWLIFYINAEASLSEDANPCSVHYTQCWQGSL